MAGSALGGGGFGLDDGLGAVEGTPSDGVEIEVLLESLSGRGCQL